MDPTVRTIGCLALAAVFLAGVIAGMILRAVIS